MTDEQEIQNSEALEALDSMVKRLNNIDGMFYWEDDAETIRAYVEKLKAERNKVVETLKRMANWGEGMLSTEEYEATGCGCSRKIARQTLRDIGEMK